jgi:hypothetical protein
MRSENGYGTLPLPANSAKYTPARQWHLQTAPEYR